jgi:flavorubredoxin
MFPLVSEAVARVVPVENLRWITFGHIESDKCGSMNQWLAAAPHTEVAHGAIGCMVSLNDLADRPPVRCRTARSSTGAASASAI